jgi:hypothetical protein
MLRDARHRNHSPLLTLLHWHYVRAGELFSIVPLRGLADFIVDGGFAFDLPVMKPYLCGADGHLPRSEALEDYPGFLDARIRFERVRELLDSVHELEPPLVEQWLPGDALVREFVGGSTLVIPHND